MLGLARKREKKKNTLALLVRGKGEREKEKKVFRELHTQQKREKEKTGHRKNGCGKLSGGGGGETGGKPLVN